MRIVCGLSFGARLAYSRTNIYTAGNHSSRAISIIVICNIILFFTFSLHIDPLKYKRHDFLGVDVSVSSDVLDGLQGEKHAVCV